MVNWYLRLRQGIYYDGWTGTKSELRRREEGYGMRTPPGGGGGIYARPFRWSKSLKNYAIGEVLGMRSVGWAGEKSE